MRGEKSGGLKMALADLLLHFVLIEEELNDE